MKKIMLYLLVVLYLMAGINHFRNPQVYLELMPPYLPAPATLNMLAGIAEILLAGLLVFRRTRKLAAYGIIAMLIAFIPTHIYMIEKHSCFPSLCVAPWVGWVRLFLFQPLLVAWAWWCRK